MRTAIHGLAAVLAVLAALCVLVMMLLTAGDVAMRSLTGRSIAGAQEVTETLMVAVVYLGIAYALYKREHVAVSVFTLRLPVRLRFALRLVGQAVMLALVVWIIWRTGAQAWRSWLNGEVRFGLLQVPVWPARMAIPVGMTAFLLQGLLDAYDQIVALATGRPDESDADPSEQTYA